MHRWGCRLHTTLLLSLTLQLFAHQDGNWSQPQPVCSIKELLHLKHLQPSVSSSKGRKVDTTAGCYVQGPSLCGRECPTSQRLLRLWSPNCAMGVRRVSFFFDPSEIWSLDGWDKFFKDFTPAILVFCMNIWQGLPFLCLGVDDGMVRSNARSRFRQSWRVSGVSGLVAPTGSCSRVIACGYWGRYDYWTFLSSSFFWFFSLSNRSQVILCVCVCVCVWFCCSFCKFYVFFIFSQFLLQFFSILIFFSYCNFYVSWFVWVFVANLMSVNFCLSFCCNFYVCWLLFEFFLQFLCVLIFVSVFVAICECVDLFQFLQFLWVLICLKFLELFVVFWTPSTLKRGKRWAKGSQQWVAKWRSFSRSQHKLTASPDSARYEQWLRNGKEINQEKEKKKTFGQRIWLT